MARYYGAIGYAENVEVRPGVFKEVYTERHYKGDIRQDLRKISEGSNLHTDIRMQNILTVVADATLLDNYMNIKYAIFRGVKWSVTNVDVQRPRLELRLGAIFNATET